MEHQIVSREAWLEPRVALHARERATMRAYDRLSAEQRAFPWVKIEKEYAFEGASGTFLGICRILDPMPKGRNESGPIHNMTGWARPRNLYGTGGTVARNGEFHPSACGCGPHTEAR